MDLHRKYVCQRLVQIISRKAKKAAQPLRRRNQRLCNMCWSSSTQAITLQSGLIAAALPLKQSISTASASVLLLHAKVYVLADYLHIDALYIHAYSCIAHYVQQLDPLKQIEVLEYVFRNTKIVGYRLREKMMIWCLEYGNKIEEKTKIHQTLMKHEPSAWPLPVAAKQDFTTKEDALNKRLGDMQAQTKRLETRKTELEGQRKLACEFGDIRHLANSKDEDCCKDSSTGSYDIRYKVQTEWAFQYRAAGICLQKLRQALILHSPTSPRRLRFPSDSTAAGIVMLLA